MIQPTDATPGRELLQASALEPAPEEKVLPFTREQFFDVFASYNEVVWPAQIVLFAIALATLGAARRQKDPRWIGWVLAGLWLWTGLVYHAFFFAPINRLAYGFAPRSCCGAR